MLVFLIHLFFLSTLILAWNNPEGAGSVRAIDQLILHIT